MDSAGQAARRVWLCFFCLCVVLVGVASLTGAPARSSAQGMDVPPDSTAGAERAAEAVKWLEPRGLNIVDMVGVVPEEHLVGGIVNYETGTGVMEYISGTRVGNVVTVHVKVTPRYGPGFTKMGCLSQHAAWDQWLSTTAAAKVNIFSAGHDITNQVSHLAYTPAGYVQPNTGPREYLRYAKPAATYTAPANSISIPANNGCTIVIYGHHEDLTATFRVEVAQVVNIIPLGHEQFMAKSYVGAGEAGLLGALAGQMSRYGDRHQRLPMTIPAGTDYVLVKFGTTDFDPYAALSNDANYGLAGSGTYRLEGNALSVDHVSMIGLPLGGTWRDLDQSGGRDWLVYIPWPNELGAPEYFLPPGFPFDPCMTRGDCSLDLLESLYNYSYPVEVYYYRVDRIPGAPLVRIPLRSVGGEWQPDAVIAAEGGGTVSSIMPPPAPTVSAPSPVFLPGISMSVPEATAQATATSVPTPVPTAPPPDDMTGCPCGWFTTDGRMVDFSPAP